MKSAVVIAAVAVVGLAGCTSTASNPGQSSGPASASALQSPLTPTPTAATPTSTTPSATPSGGTTTGGAGSTPTCKVSEQDRIVRLKVNTSCILRSSDPRRWRYAISNPAVLAATMDTDGWVFTGTAVGYTKVDGYQDENIKWHLGFRVL
ncbi:MAG: hypothetical protein WCI74_08500 [Actinomycetes bacterium]